MSASTPAPRPLQPDKALLGDLAAVEDRAASDELERLADQAIVTTLQLQGFDTTTADWHEFARALAEYGYGVFTGWGIVGALRTMAARHNRGKGVLGLPKLPEGLRLTPDQARSLATDVTIAAVDAFRSKTLMNPRRTWTITGGASLKTYFIGRALMELPDAYVSWDSRENGGPEVIDLRDSASDDGRHSIDPAVPALAAADLEAIEDGDPVGVVMFRLQSAGYSREEIAEMTGMTMDAVRTRMYRLRHALTH